MAWPSRPELSLFCCEAAPLPPSPLTAVLVPERLLPCFYHYIAYIAFSALAVSPSRKGLHDGGCKDFSGSVYRALALASPAGVCGVPMLSQIDATGGFNVS